MAKNYYLILGLRRDATHEEIRSAYRHMVKAYHPDHYGADSGPFLQIQEAYEVLSDPKRKRAYDNIQRIKPKSREIFRDVTSEAFSRSHMEPFSPRRNENPFETSRARSFDTFTSAFDEIFDYLWSNFSGHTGRNPKRTDR